MLLSDDNAALSPYTCASRPGNNRDGDKAMRSTSQTSDPSTDDLADDLTHDLTTVTQNSRALSRRMLLRGSGALALAAGAATLLDERAHAQDDAAVPAMRVP